MPKFTYKARKDTGELANGQIDAENETTAFTRLSEKGYYPIEIKPLQLSPALQPLVKIRPTDIGLFTRQLSNLLESGLPLLRALNVLSEQTTNLRFKSVIESLSAVVKQGGTLSEACTKYPKIFSQFYISMLRAGEIAGNLEAVLSRLADFNEQQEEIKTKVSTALAYPAILAAVGSLTILILIVFVVPRLTTMFEEMSQILPLPTRILIGLSEFFKAFWWLLAALVGLVIFSWMRQRGSAGGRRAIDNFKLKLPLLGELIKKREIGRLTRTLAALLANGVPVLKSLEIATQTLGNAVLKDDLKAVTKGLAAGGSLSKEIGKSGNFPVFVVNMVSVGEESGSLEKALFRIADIYQRELDRILKIFTSWLEPLMILVMGSNI